MDTTQDMPVPPATSEPVTALVGGLNSAGTTGRHTSDVGGAGASRHVAPAGPQGSAATGAQSQDVAADPWPSWAQPQLHAAVAITARIVADGAARSLAAELHRRWYAPELSTTVDLDRSWGPLGGVYRRAHAGSGAPITADGISVVDRHDVISRDGWWRTWGDEWSPIRSRSASTRVLLSPRPDALPEFVHTLTAALLDEPVPWLLACPTDPRRLRHAASAVLYVPDTSVITADLIDQLAPMLRPQTPQLCLPLAPGIAASEYPASGMSFGEHRCHLVALGLQHPDARRDPLHAIAHTFASHGIDPAAPHRSAGG